MTTNITQLTLLATATDVTQFLALDGGVTRLVPAAIFKRDLKGYSGSRGYIGSLGFTGSQGAYDAIGFTGSIGYAGSKGYDGSRGFVGSQSTATGYSGSRGYTGSAGYTPATPSQWASPAPTDVQTAIDRIAARIYTLTSNTAIP
jgi:hypothetical protein